MQVVAIDCIGEMCPIPIIKAEKQLQNLQTGDELHIKTDHSCTMQAVVNHFQRKMGYPSSSEEIDYGIWNIKIRKQVKK
ncbi:sulfurtransferase TusA family protein [Desulfuribacillus alkaliarsenatis]|uniref:UPF0033 domain-containing protein n=1 Tax=Desulfuribacillus alkaliarsenatis TaxID=766136 RepID=A0A1E5G1K1_9FIRM|nr:sulfurtransferase TusA family protein [Desulfuribacillus alkaliarsenatis]OEF96743.1 hypothetical protein BHF68_06630 [Desulfuribacillus alkaliarsenatis]